MQDVDTTTAELMEQPAHPPSSADVTGQGRLWTELLTVAGFCAFLFYFGLGSFGLIGADEPRYAQIAREMLARHDWVTPVLNGVPWLEKPILYYWGAMLSYSIFGVSDWAARVPSAVCATAMVFAIYFFMRRFLWGSQQDAALMAASSAAIIGFARAASTDMPLAAMFTIALLAWYTWLESARRRWLAAFYLFIGIGMLAKGPVAPFLAGVIVVVLASIRREPRLILRTLWWPGVLLFVVVAAPWYVAVQWRNPEFFRTFFLAHNLERFAQDVFHHSQPFWYYVPVLLLSVAPWTVYAVAALVRSVADFRGSHPLPAAPTSVPDKARGTQGADSRRRCLRWFLIIWLLAPVLFFSVSQSKLPGYILPAVPAWALLLASYLQKRIAGGSKPRVVLVIMHSAVGSLLLGAVLLARSFVLRIPVSTEELNVAAIASAVIFVAMVATLRWRGLRWLRFVTLVPLILGLAFVIRIVAPVLDTQSARSVERELERIAPTRMQLAVFQERRELEYGLNFYRNQAIRNYDRGEIPSGEHLVIAPEGRQPGIQALVPDRRVVRIGDFGIPVEVNPSGVRLQFFWVSAPGGGQEHHHE